MLLQPWGFKIDDVECKRIFLWHGEEDRVMPIAPARLLAGSLANCVATYYADEGHFSLLANHAQEIFAALKP
jgi:pimeloyl-ACP methyl ester carboxylesterase